MFIGHYGIAFGLKKTQSGLSLGLLFLAVQFNDLLWPVLVLLGIEKLAIVPGTTKANPMDFVYYPYSHSLAASVLFALMTAGLVLVLPLPWTLRRSKAALVLGTAVLSHFILDWIVHKPDLPLLGGGSYKVGLGLWNHVAVSYTLETALFITGVCLYLKATSAKDAVGRYGVHLFAVILVAFNLINLFATPPPDSKAIAGTGLILLLLLAGVAFWLDKHRIPVNSAQ